jgi:hypothetical protein
MMKQQPMPMSGEPQFKDSQFMTAEEKCKVIKDWEKFLAGGLNRQDFTKSLYRHLILHCSFIAHYDIHGFYAEYFKNGDDTLRFLSQFDRANGCRSIEYGEDYWIRNGNDVSSQYSDINNAMADVAGKYIPVLVAAAEKKQRDQDLGMARAILAKHDVKVEIPE